MLNSVSRTSGTTQLGFLTMSSNVAFGEKNTPMIRPIAPIAGCDCASGAGRDVVVAIEDPPPRAPIAGATLPPSTPHYAETPQKFHDRSRAVSPPILECGSLATAFTIAAPPGRFSNSPRYSMSRQFRHSRQQLPRISMSRLPQHLLHRPALHKHPRPHTRHARSHLRHHRQAMRNKNVSKRKLLLQLLQQK